MQFKKSSAPQLSEPRFFKIPETQLKEWSDIAINDKIIFASIIYWLLGIIFTLSVIVIFSAKIPFEIPLFYSRVWGEEQLAPRNYLFILPAGLLALGIFNITYGLLSYSKNKEVSYLLASGTVILVTFVALGVVNILHLVT